MPKHLEDMISRERLIHGSMLEEPAKGQHLSNPLTIGRAAQVCFGGVGRERLMYRLSPYPKYSWQDIEFRRGCDLEYWDLMEVLAGTIHPGRC